MLIFATAVHCKVGVVTGDIRLAREVESNASRQRNMAPFLKEVVQEKKAKKSSLVEKLQSLASRNDYLLGKPNPTWSDLKDDEFPP